MRYQRTVLGSQYPKSTEEIMRKPTDYIPDTLTRGPFSLYSAVLNLDCGRRSVTDADAGKTKEIMCHTPSAAAVLSIHPARMPLRPCSNRQRATNCSARWRSIATSFDNSKRLNSDIAKANEPAISLEADRSAAKTAVFEVHNLSVFKQMEQS
jgi:hypothetical protein